MKQALAALLVAVALVAVAGPAAAHKKTKPTPSPLLQSPPPTGAMGYYLMVGTRIVSQAYPNVAACYADLAKVRKSMVPGADMVVCVHRRP